MTKRPVEREEHSEPRGHAVVDGLVPVPGYRPRRHSRRGDQAERREGRRVPGYVADTLADVRGAGLSVKGRRWGLPVGVEKSCSLTWLPTVHLYYCGLKTAPTALVTCCYWDHCCDLLTICDFERVITTRGPEEGGRVDIFAPEVLIWAYEVRRSMECGPCSIRALRPPRRVHHRLPSTRRSARTPGSATPDDDPTKTLARPGQNPDRPAHHRDKDSGRWSRHQRRWACRVPSPGWSPVESKRTPDACGSRRPVGHQHHPSRGEVCHVR